MKLLHYIWIGTTALFCGCASNSSASESDQPENETVAEFHSTDPDLEKTFNWAKKTALGYAHDSDDPVGAWYEAALPQREAFCMRDVSHQSVGAHILGLGKHNKNMLHKFVSNINESRDFCSFWEINRYDRPAPADYNSDSEFWYNLNANADVMQACLKMYEWTDDKDYLSDKDFINFYDISTSSFLDRWQLQPDNIMERPPYMNQPADFNPDNNFHTCRGLPSYVENFRGLTVGVDLLATLYGGFEAYSRIAALSGDGAAAILASSKAQKYRDLIDNLWWDNDNNRFNTFWTSEGKFYRGEGVPFILWFDATSHPERKQACVNDILSTEWNVENMSAFPAIFYKLGYNEEAYKYLTTLPATNRSDYPEVSFGVIEGIVCGAMGFNPSASKSSVTSLSRIADQDCSINNIPLFDGSVSLSHSGMTSSRMVNSTGKDLKWEASFQGNHPIVICDGKEYAATLSEDARGNAISTVIVDLPSNSTKEVRIK